MAGLPKMRKYFNHDLMISMEAPDGWDIITTEEHPLGLFAAEEDGYRAHVSFKVDVLVPPTVERFGQLVKETYHAGDMGLSEYKLVEDYLFELDESPAFAARFEWVAQEVGVYFSQLDLLVLAAENAFYLVHGYSLKSLKEKYIPIFEHVLGSLRFIPAR